MLSHAVPSPDRAPALSPNAATKRLKRACSRAEGLPGGSISFEFHPPLRRQGADLDTRAVPSGAGEGRLRRRLRLSVAGRAGARLRRQCADRRDRFVASDDAALFAVPRRFRDGALGHERGAAPRRGGAGVLRGTARRLRWGLAPRRCSSARGTSSRSGSRRAFRLISNRRGSAFGGCARSATRRRRRGRRDEPRRARWARPYSCSAQRGDGSARSSREAASMSMARSAAEAMRARFSNVAPV